MGACARALGCTTMITKGRLFLSKPTARPSFAFRSCARKRPAGHVMFAQGSEGVEAVCADGDDDSALGFLERAQGEGVREGGAA